MDVPEVLVVADAAAWRAWLDEHETTHDGLWLLLAKQGVREPTALTIGEALEEALCSGWIDGQSKRVDERVYRQRFTPRRRASLWSARNVGLAAALFGELGGRNRYAVIHRVVTAPSAAARGNRLAKLVGMLERGETPYPR